MVRRERWWRCPPYELLPVVRTPEGFDRFAGTANLHLREAQTRSGASPGMDELIPVAPLHFLSCVRLCAPDGGRCPLSSLFKASVRYLPVLDRKDLEFVAPEADDLVRECIIETLVEALLYKPVATADYEH